nr:DEAD/DEAH box helicase [Propionibacteriales bacterium]
MTILDDFARLYDFSLDVFQRRACESLEQGHGVLVAAPTGSGKTLVGEFAVHLALAHGGKCFYTTPIKALSNQKFADLTLRYGADRVGLLTGDNTINGDASVVVMTTEVLRNMLYAGSSTLSGLQFVVMDEVHYLADRSRGAVWEEVIIHLPESVTVVSLSATVSNAEEFGEWLATVRGHNDNIVEERRPVPLFQHVMVGQRLYDLFSDSGDLGNDGSAVNPRLTQVAGADWRRSRARDHRSKRGHNGSPSGRGLVPSRTDVVERLDADGLLPAIMFIFSRKGCDAAVQQCLQANLRLTTPSERSEIRAFVETRTSVLSRSDLEVLGYPAWLEALARGVSSHHAGMLPVFKECVEELFSRGLVRIVFATETLALGINMPARSVVIDKLSKWNGETHADMTPGEYTQLTGRAGRRGIDVEGHAVVLWAPDFDPKAVAGLASTRTYPLRSSFRPSYNMAVNLVRQFGKDTARELLESSFTQFQADRAVVGLARQVRKAEEALDGYAQSVSCERGDFMEYAGLRRALSDREAALSKRRRIDRKDAAVASLDRLRIGDVIEVPAGRWSGFAIVIDPGVRSGRDGPRPLVLTAERQARRLSLVDFPTPVEPLTRMRIAKTFNARNPQQRRDLASLLRERTRDLPSRGRPGGNRDPAQDDAEIRRLREAIREHPCHACEQREDHARWAERHLKLQRETETLRRRIDQRTNTIAREFDRVCDVLEELDYLADDQVTSAGASLARIYSELDLVAAECLRRGTWDDLEAPALAAVLSALVFESRSLDDSDRPRVPGGAVRRVLGDMVSI